MEDEVIIGLYLRRDETAITQTERKYGPYCGAIARNLLSLPEDAEECLNDTWLTAWNQIPPTMPRCLRVFLGRIVRNLSISRFRADHAQKRYSGPELLLSELEECLPGGQTVEQDLERQELTRALERWLDELSPEDRRLFLRRYWYGIPVRQLAAEAEQGENLTAQRLYRLRKRLKRRLEKEELM